MNSKKTEDTEKQKVMTEVEGKKQLKSSESKAKEYFENPEKMKKLLEEGTKKAQGIKGPLEEMVNMLKVLFSLVKDYLNGSYKVIPKASIIVIIGALIYFVSPFDFYLDFLPGGYVDDALVIGLAYKQIKADIEKYKVWKNIE
jgi:uncharacterized membrane protein YkvA (DUF1232 family)